MRRIKIGYLSWHPAPYRDAFINCILRRAEFDVKVFTAKVSGDEHTFDMPSYPTEILMPLRKSTVGVLYRMLRRIVFGGFDYTFWPGFMSWPVIVCQMVCAVLRKKYVFCTDCVEERKGSFLRGWLRRYIVKNAYSVIVGGNAGRDFFAREYNVPFARILDGVYSLDGDVLEKTIADLTLNRKEIRARYCLAESNIVYLMVANMTPNRCYKVTLEGFVKFSSRHPECRFVACGTGPELEAIQEIALAHKSIIVIPGVPFDKMLELYAMADVYVHGGKEPASTALQIGAIARLPLISSKAVGLSWDMLVDCESGVAIRDYQDATQWESGFEKMWVCRNEWGKWGGRARELSRKLDAAIVAGNFVAHFANNEDGNQ